VDAGVARFVGGAAVLPATVRGGRALTVLGEVDVVGDVPDGQVEVLVRPEQVLLGVDGAAVKARVDEVAYYGHDAAVTLTLLPDGPVVVGRIGGWDVPDPGTTVTVAVSGPVVVFS
jgi:iron(III) transport system ATP-binding protein